ncbi:MAG: DUF1080 domain-containing protein [Planctomycetaceae bacterium]
MTSVAWVRRAVCLAGLAACLAAAAAGSAGPAAGEDFAPRQDLLPVPPPPGAVVVVGAGTLPRVVGMDGAASDWLVEDGELVVTPSPQHANHVHTVDLFEDADLHAEFVVHPRAQGNSGLYFHGWFEMQIYDSHGVDPVTEQDEGSLYRFAKPLVNAARPAGQWQVYDIRYTAPRRGPDGAVTRPGSIVAWLNGKKVQDGVEFDRPRSPYIPYRHGVTDHLRGVEKTLLETGRGPLFLQDHGSPTRYRNVWFVRR